MSNVTAIQSAQPATGARFKITAEIEGFPVEIEIEGKADALKALLDRLKAIAAEPPQAKSASKASGQSGPLCRIHNKPMMSSRKPDRKAF